MDHAERARLQRLMTALAEGDRGAFHPVFERLWPLVRGFVARQLGPVEAEDVAQQALLKVFERAGEFDPELDALSWVLGVAAYEVRTMKRRTWRRREDLGDAAALASVRDGGPTPEDAAEAAELRASAAAVLGALRAGDVETLVAVARGERPPDGGATFRKRVERAVARFRDAWRTRHDP